MESTARAERFELQSAAVPAYSWEVPQKPVTIRIPYAVIDKLEGEAVENFRSLNSRGSEIGGVLFGKASGSEPILVSVEDYELIACDYSRGPLYRLAEADLVRFDRVIAQHAGAGVLPVVGFFRSHTRKGLALDAEDLALFESRFKDPRRIALLMRPFATKASTAGFFFWEGGAVHGDSSYLEFPFRSSQLSTFKPAEVADPGLNAHGLGGSALPVPSVPKTSARGQIVPIATRREVFPAAVPPAVNVVAELPAVSEAPLEVAEPTAPSQPEISSPPPVAAAPEPPAAKAEPPAAKVESPAPKIEQPAAKVEAPAAKVEAPAPKLEAAAARPEPPAAKTVNPPWNKTSSKKPAKAAVEPPVKAPETGEKPVVETAARTAETTEEQIELVPVRSNKLIWVAVGAIVPLILMVVLFVYPALLRRSKPSTTSGLDATALSLRVERTGGELQLSWNRDSDPIRSATKGVLSISDGSQHQDVELDLAQLQKGSIAYTPATGDVVFRMEVSGKGQSKTASEMVRALSTRPSPLANDPLAAAPPAAPAPDSAVATPATAVTDTPPAEEESKTPQRPLKPFRADNLSARLHAAPAATELPDAPTLSRVDTPNAAVSALNLSPSAPVAPPKPAPAPAASVPSAPAPAPPVEKKAPTGGQIQQAVLIHRKEPDYPRLARETGAKGVVELTATIGVDGKVKKVTPVKGHPMLVKAASDAVMQWTYRPTILNGVPVEAQTQVLINFMGDR